MNEQNNNINNNLSDGQVETLHPMPSTVTTTTQQPQVATVSSINTNQNNNETPSNQESPKKVGNFKYILAFIFLIGILAFVFFLPEISTYVQSKKTSTSNTTNTQIENGTLTCSLDKTTDETDTYYEIDYVFTNKKLITSNLITTIESTNTEYLNTKKLEYDTASSIANNISGISMDCSLSAGILTISENYTHKDIDTNKLTSYVEAGGTYPEFKYQKNIYDIQTTMIKKGYDCSITASVK